ncbi:MAG: hypothetical protein EA342_03465, partial [Leptolyngbya sp. LCM1.Bin17]
MQSPNPPDNQPNGLDSDNSSGSDLSRQALAEQAERFNVPLDSPQDGLLQRWPRFVPIGLLLGAFVVWTFV